jgi:hypothetical protein
MPLQVNYSPLINKLAVRNTNFTVLVAWPRFWMPLMFFMYEGQRGILPSKRELALLEHQIFPAGLLNTMYLVIQ